MGRLASRRGRVRAPEGEKRGAKLLAAGPKLAGWAAFILTVLTIVGVAVHFAVDRRISPHIDRVNEVIRESERNVEQSISGLTERVARIEGILENIQAQLTAIQRRQIVDAEDDSAPSADAQ